MNGERVGCGVTGKSLSQKIAVKTNFRARFKKRGGAETTRSLLQTGVQTECPLARYLHIITPPYHKKGGIHR